MRRPVIGAMVAIVAAVGAIGTALAGIRVIEDPLPAQAREGVHRRPSGRGADSRSPDLVVGDLDGVTLQVEFWAFDLTANQILWDELLQQPDQDGSAESFQRLRSGAATPKCVRVAVPLHPTRATDVRRDLDELHISVRVTHAVRDGGAYSVSATLEGERRDNAVTMLHTSAHRDLKLRLGDDKVFGRGTFELFNKNGKPFLRCAVLWRVTAWTAVQA